MPIDKWGGTIFHKISLSKTQYWLVWGLQDPKLDLLMQFKEHIIPLIANKINQRVVSIGF